MALLALALALGILWQGARLVFRPDVQDELRRANALFAAGRYYDARAAYVSIVARWPLTRYREPAAATPAELEMR